MDEPVDLGDDSNGDTVELYEANLPAQNPTPDSKKVTILAILCCTALLVCIFIAVSVTASQAARKSDSGETVTPGTPPALSQSFTDLIRIERLVAHLEEFEKIATRFSNSRSIENGYNASADYVMNVLRTQAPSLHVWTQPFEVDMYKSIVPATLTMTAPYQIPFSLSTDFVPFHGFSGSINLSASVSAPGGQGLGCGLLDFIGFPPGGIALIRRGNCTFNDKVRNAVMAGADGALIYNDGEGPDRVGPFGGRIDNQTIPCFALSYGAGMLFKQQGAEATMEESTESYKVTTFNVLAETPTGDSNNVVTVGTHLDSVPAGPGINDNGSGSSTNLEMAIAVHALGSPFKNKIRFAWWGAEEIGLLGSKYYVSQLSEAELGTIALNLDFDMLGSPNYYLGVYDGRNAAQSTIRNASGTIQDIFTKYFTLQGLENAWDFIPFDGRSDYGPFIERDIPAGGIFAGAEVVKTPEQRDKIGGLANAAYDPCYHQSCDTVTNVNKEGFILMAKAAADAVQIVASQAHLRAWLSGKLGSIVIS